MKSLSLAALLLTLVVTWKLFQKLDSREIELHSRIQNMVSDTIQKTLQQKYGLLDEILFRELWSEVQSKDSIRVNFQYLAHFRSQSPSIRKAGWAIFKKEDSKEKISWVLQEVRHKTEDIHFLDSLPITNQPSDVEEFEENDDYE